MRFHEKRTKPYRRKRHRQREYNRLRALARKKGVKVTSKHARVMKEFDATP